MNYKMAINLDTPNMLGKLADLTNLKGLHK